MEPERILSYYASFIPRTSELEFYKWISLFMAFWSLCAACHENSPGTRLLLRRVPVSRSKKHPS
ncbi:hypothetical protein KC19_1G248600 [Ceratodon purpureus]|uniref:Uncharacterized protein n=1 Tax=Ceratodon purpureus TaxID=3225 RepID=A0A8T0J901_CERPU|nr:hypothetical protein KC19_1G248600 [Ceratodon purpureus]